MKALIWKGQVISTEFSAEMRFPLLFLDRKLRSIRGCVLNCRARAQSELTEESWTRAARLGVRPRCVSPLCVSTPPPHTDTHTHTEEVVQY